MVYNDSPRTRYDCLLVLPTEFEAHEDFVHFGRPKGELRNALKSAIGLYREHDIGRITVGLPESPTTAQVHGIGAFIRGVGAAHGDDCLKVFYAKDPELAALMVKDTAKKEKWSNLAVLVARERVKRAERIFDTIVGDDVGVRVSEYIGSGSPESKHKEVFANLLFQKHFEGAKGENFEQLAARYAKLRQE